MDHRREVTVRIVAALRNARLIDEISVEIDDKTGRGSDPNTQSTRRNVAELEVFSEIELTLHARLHDAWVRLPPGSVVVGSFVPIPREKVGKNPGEPGILIAQSPVEKNGEVRLAWLALCDENGVDEEVDVHRIATFHERQERETIGRRGK